MKHLSAESALYFRILTEGLLGIEPLSFQAIQLAPTLPADWDFLELNRLVLFGKEADLSLRRKGNKILVEVKVQGKSILKKSVTEGSEVVVGFWAGYKNKKGLSSAELAILILQSP